MKCLQSAPMLILSFLLAFSLISCGGDTQSQGNSEVNTQSNTTEVLIFGGGDHHDFERWFNVEDSTIIAGTGASVSYTDDPEEAVSLLESIDLLVMNTNQAIDHEAYPDAILEFVEAGNGLVLIHAATWFIWDWPDYFSNLIGGGTNSHGPLGEFEVYVNDGEHPVMQNVPTEFNITDELYRFQRDEEATEIHVLATGIEPDSGDEYPVVWTTEHGDGKIVNITLGHDGDAHTHEAYIAMLENSIEWLQEE